LFNRKAGFELRSEILRVAKPRHRQSQTFKNYVL